MLEQSKRNAPVYYTEETKDEHGRAKLINKVVNITDIEFGQAMLIKIHRNPHTTDFMVVYPQLPQPNGFIYSAKGVPKQQVVSKNNKDDEITTYWYGTAKYKTALTPYLITNQPNVTLNMTTNLNHFELPPELGGFGYNYTFKYLPQLVELIGDCPATYTDRYKRPLNYSSLINHHLFFPIALEKVATKFNQIVKNAIAFPAVVILNPPKKDIRFAVIDLEPGYTDEDYQIANSFDAYYHEDTPRGGKHYLVKSSSTNTAFKYRITPHIEVQTRAQITFYGINGTFINKTPIESDFSNYQEIGHSSINIDTNQPAGVGEAIDAYRQLIDQMGTTGKQQANRIYLTDSDKSHADFMALLTLYRVDFKPLESTFDMNLLPWVLAGYAANVIPGRVKHDSMRDGVPYLVYLANKIIYYEQKGS